MGTIFQATVFPTLPAPRFGGKLMTKANVEAIIGKSHLYYGFVPKKNKAGVEIGYVDKLMWFILPDKAGTLTTYVICDNVLKSANDYNFKGYEILSKSTSKVSWRAWKSNPRQSTYLITTQTWVNYFTISGFKNHQTAGASIPTDFPSNIGLKAGLNYVGRIDLSYDPIGPGTFSVRADFYDKKDKFFDNYTHVQMAGGTITTCAQDSQGAVDGILNSVDEINKIQGILTNVGAIALGANIPLSIMYYTAATFGSMAVDRILRRGFAPLVGWLTNDLCKYLAVNQTAPGVSIASFINDKGLCALMELKFVCLLTQVFQVDKNGKIVTPDKGHYDENGDYVITVVDTHPVTACVEGEFLFSPKEGL